MKTGWTTKRYSITPRSASAGSRSQPGARFRPRRWPSLKSKETRLMALNRSLCLEDLVRKARLLGWASGVGSVDDARTQARTYGWAELSTRIGEAPLAVLIPKEVQEARPRSLSALYGMGPQPLHTDLAHRSTPPDLVVLAAKAPRRTPTLLWNLVRQGVDLPVQSELSHGIFLIDSGREAFHATAAYEDGIRFDPGCMVPCDQRSRRVAAFFREAVHSAHEHRWQMSNQLLVIDNRKTLHARAAVVQEDDKQPLFRISFIQDMGRQS